MFYWEYSIIIQANKISQKNVNKISELEEVVSFKDQKQKFERFLKYESFHENDEKLDNLSKN